MIERNDRRGLLRIATWNLERVSLRSWLKLPRILRQIAAVDADVWVMTESRVGLPLSDAYPFVVHAPAHASRRPDTDERWVSIWSRYPLADADVVASPWDAVAAVVGSPVGDIVVYGTVLPWSHERDADGGLTLWSVHEAELERQAAEWLDLGARHEAVCIAGDFNQSWRTPGCGTHHLRERHRAAIAAAGLTCLTEDVIVDGLPVIDHIMLTDAWSQSRSARVAATWGRRSDDGVEVTDHSGVAVDLFAPSQTS